MSEEVRPDGDTGAPVPPRPTKRAPQGAPESAELPAERAAHPHPLPFMFGEKGSHAVLTRGTISRI